MPSVGFAVHFGSGVGPGQIGAMARSARARDKTARFHERDRRFESVSSRGEAWDHTRLGFSFSDQASGVQGSAGTSSPTQFLPPWSMSCSTCRLLCVTAGQDARAFAFSQLIADGIVAEDSARASSGWRR